ncbi:MAG: hypothetical protein P8J78_10605 [Maricaulis sp.]|nr:hypothetical protein [Maricaulis sp.]MDG2045053.1 hypothetical protein [Maricaulis sp.]
MLDLIYVTIKAETRRALGLDKPASTRKMMDNQRGRIFMYDRLKQLEVLRESFENNGWALAHQLFPAEVAQAVLHGFQRELGNTRESYKGIWAKGPFTDNFCFESYAYNNAYHGAILWTLTPYMQAMSGKELLPTTSYFRVYRKGDVCKLHMDRPAAEYAISLTLGYSDGINWPLWVSEDSFEAREDRDSQAAHIPDDSQFGMLRVPMEPGDAVIYDGVQRLHGRNDPNPNRWSAHLFFDFVDRNGPYAKEAFDNRTDHVLRESDFIFPDKDGPKRNAKGGLKPLSERRKKKK